MQNAPRSSYDTLAVIGSRVITTDQFTRLYRDKLVRYGLSDNEDARQGYLRNLIDDEVLIWEAKTRKLDRTKGARAELERVKVQQLLNAFTERHIAPGVTVSDDDLRDLFVKMNTKLKVRHLYAATRAEAVTLSAELSRGASFEDLARSVFADPRLRENGGLLGYISVDEMDARFEAAAYAMRVGEISKPVKTVQGYSILRVDDIQRNPFVTESEFARVKERLRAFARRRRLEQALVDYSAVLRRWLDLRFDRGLMARLFALLGEEWSASSREPSPSAFSVRDQARTLLRTAQGVWTLEKVRDAMGTMAEAQRKWIRTEENLEDVLAGLVIRQHIVEMAKREKLDEAPSYREGVEEAFDTYLLTTLEHELKKGIRFTQDSVRSAYLLNRERFRTPAETRLGGILVEDAGLADSIRQLLDRGAPFDLLARDFSIQKATADWGGDLGFFRREELGDLGDELFALKVGEWKGPVVRDGKQLFVKCSGFSDSSIKSFEASAKEIEGMLVAAAWTGERARAVESFKKKVNCRVYPERLMTLSVN